MNANLKAAAFHAYRALEALQDPRNGDDDVEQARQQHLFGLLDSLARMPASAVAGNPQCLAATIMYARQSLCHYLRGSNALAQRALEHVTNGYLLRQVEGLAA